MFKDKKVVVTGGTGFIGTHYIEELLSRGARVITHTRPQPYTKKLRLVDERIEVCENIDLENIDSLENELSSLEKKLSKKYKTHLEEKDQEDLDTQK